MRARKEAALRRRNTRLAILIAGAVVSLLVVFLCIRGIVGCVSRHFSDTTTTEVESKADSGKNEAAVTEEKAAPVTINLMMIGDILQHRGVYESGYLDDGTRNYDHIFAHIGDQLTDADIKVVNQETLLGGTMFEFSGYPTFNGPQEMGDAEVKAGFNVVLRATNHAMDMGYEGLHSELSYWHTQHPEIAVIGAVDPDDSSASIEDVYIYEKDGFKIALLNYTFDLNGFEDPQNKVSWLDEDHVRRTVQAADASADMVVVFPHWGEEYNLEPVEYQRQMAQIFMDAGADVIIGGHPHVIEPVEILTASDGRKVPCFWSVGNFVCTQVDNENLVGGVAKVSFAKESDGTSSITGASFVPTICHKGIGSAMTTYLLRDYNDDLAATNYLESNETDNTSLTVAWANEFCTQVLGPNFDTSSEQIVFGPESFTPSAPVSQMSSGDSSSSEKSADDGGVSEGQSAEELDEAA